MPPPFLKEGGIHLNGAVFTMFSPLKKINKKEQN